MTDKTLQDRLRDPSHGFDRNDSHTEDRYVCLCEHLANEAADALDAQAERIKALEGALRGVMPYWTQPHGTWWKGACSSTSNLSRNSTPFQRARALLEGK